MQLIGLAILCIVGLLPLAAVAQQQPDPVQAGLMLSLDLQKKAVAAQDLTQALAAAKNRIAELEKLCGEPCKLVAEVK
jgi:hypothetical protein